MSEIVLKAEGLRKVYKGYAAVDDFSIEIKKGEIYGLVGQNGAGKTTFLRIITGLIMKSAGRYELFGVSDSENIGKVRQKVSAVVETPSLYYNLSAFDNLKEQSIVLGLNDDKNIYQLLDIVNLSYTGTKKAKDFSLGMKQRLGIALALLNRPEFLILDEPTNGLDPQGIKEVRELLVRLNKEQGITILVSSHILSELFKFATVYAFMDKGRLIEEATYEQIKASVKKGMLLTVDSTAGASAVLEKLGVEEYRILSGTLLEIKGSFDFADAAVAFKEAGIKINGFEETDEDLESYYLKLVGGTGR